MKTNAEQLCRGCGQRAGGLTIYRDPFGVASAPGRWPTLAMHSDCFLAYIAQRRSRRVASASR